MTAAGWTAASSKAPAGQEEIGATAWRRWLGAISRGLRGRFVMSPTTARLQEARARLDAAAARLTGLGICSRT